jgi:hypothetical protein
VYNKLQVKKINYLIDSSEIRLSITVEHLTKSLSASLQITFALVETVHRQGLCQLQIVLVIDNGLRDVIVIVTKQIVPRKIAAKVLDE